jgi:hypothetical protein
MRNNTSLSVVVAVVLVNSYDGSGSHKLHKVLNKLTYRKI